MPQRNESDDSSNEIKKKRALLILNAAEALFGELGYDGVSARSIAERAGVNKALVFYYWGSKAELFGSVLERYYKRHREALASAFETEGTLKERVYRMIDSYLDFIEANRLYPRLIQQQVSSGGPHLKLVQRHLATFFKWSLEILSEIAPDNGPTSPRQLYLSISSIVVNYFTYTPALGEELWGRDPMSPEALAERREHIHWLVDTLLTRIETQKS